MTSLSYGFPMREKSSITRQLPLAIVLSLTLLLPAVINHVKLHGSLNWRIKVGFMKPYPLGGIVHHEGWGTAQSQNYSSDWP